LVDRKESHQREEGEKSKSLAPDVSWEGYCNLSKGKQALHEGCREFWDSKKIFLLGGQ